MIKGTATWAYDDDPASDALYVALDGRAAPPYRTQVHVEAILDLGGDGSLAGIEILGPVNGQRIHVTGDRVEEGEGG